MDNLADPAQPVDSTLSVGAPVAAPVSEVAAAAPAEDPTDLYMQHFADVQNNIKKLNELFGKIDPNYSTNDRVKALIEWVALSQLQHVRMFDLCVEMNNFFGGSN